jgi:hypothetical protein
MTTAILIIAAAAAVLHHLKEHTTTLDAPDDFACGSDEVCYCEKAKDCIKKK